MAYAGWKQNNWNVQVDELAPAPGPLFGLQDQDMLEFSGEGDGGAMSIVSRKRGTAAPEAWGSMCLYSNGNGESVQGIHIASGQPFIVFRTAPGTPTHSGSVYDQGVAFAKGAKKKKQKKDDGCSGSGSGSWTAQEGG